MRLRFFSLYAALLHAALLMIVVAARAGDGVSDSSKNSPSVSGVAPPIDLPRDMTELYRLVKRFDFDERKLGNYEAAPMHWERLTGPGLPAYATGEFDESIGHTAPPSFKLSIATGSIGYEYRELDLPVVPDSDYLVVGFCRTQGLHRAAAFLEAELVDQFGDPLPGTQTISNLIRSPRDKSDDWQRMELRTSTNDPRAFALRLQLWILQDHVWQDPPPDDPDPIIRDEVRAAAWFDDIVIYRMPRVRVRLSEAAGIVAAGTPPRFELALQIAPAQRLSVELEIHDERGQVVQSVRREIVGDERRSVARVEPLRSAAFSLSPASEDAIEQVLGLQGDALEPGNYEATLRILGRSEPLMERQLRFAVLPGALPPPGAGFEMGLDLGVVGESDPAALVALLKAIGCNAVKLSLPFPVQDAVDNPARALQLTRMVRELVQQRIEVTGELRGQERLTDMTAQSLRSSAYGDRLWARRLNPLLAQLGGLVTVWQLGSAPVELREGLWTAAQLADVRRYFRRFLSVPELATPCSALTPGNSGGDIASIWVSAGIPTRSLGPMLEDALATRAGRAWLELESPPQTLDPHWRQIELSRRIVIAKAVQADRLLVAAPFALSGESDCGWVPTNDFQIIRTAFHLLRGRHPVEILHPTADSILLLFDGDGDGCAVAWTWRAAAIPDRFDYWFGTPAGAVDMRGTPVTLESHGGQTAVPLRPEPIFIYGIDVGLARLAASFNVGPTLIEPQRADSMPALTLRNTYSQAISGEIHTRAPANWKIEPSVARFRLEPGEELSQAYVLTAPPRRFANTLPFQFDVNIETPRTTALHFDVAMTVSLRDLAMTAQAHREGAVIIVEQTLANHSDKPVSFAAFLDPPVGRRQEAAISLKPGGTQTLVYTVSDEQPPGQPMAISIRENNGSRTLDLLVESPP